MATLESTFLVVVDHQSNVAVHAQAWEVPLVTIEGVLSSCPWLPLVRPNDFKSGLCKAEVEPAYSSEQLANA
jgi:hypothetical protein